MAGAITRGKLIRADLANWDGKTSTHSRIDATGGTVTGLAVGNEVDVLQVFGSGTDRTRASIRSATSHIGTTTCTLVFAPGTWTIDDDLTIQSNLAAKIPTGCVFSVSSGKTLTFSGPVYAESSTFYSGAGTTVLSVDSIVGGKPWVARIAAEVSAGATPTDYTRLPEPVMDSRRQGGVATANVQTAVNATTGTNEEVAVVAVTPTYDETVSWKGRPHHATGLPFAINRVTWSGNDLAARACVSDGLLYVCEYAQNKVALFSLDDPRDPVYILSYTVGNAPRHVEVVGRYMFVCNNGDNTITVYDLSNPATATLCGTIATSANPKMFCLVGNNIYVVCNTSQQVEQYRFFLPTSGVTGFSYVQVATLTISALPFSISYNGAGLLAIVGAGGANVDIVGSSLLNLISQTAIGGITHGTCTWASKTQLLFTDNTNGRLYSCDVSTLTPVVSSFAATTTATPEQIEVVGSRCYVTNLTVDGVAGSVDCFDITDVRNPVLYKNVPCVGEGTGFTAFYGDDRSAFLYVTCHFTPYGLDIIEVPIADPNNREPPYFYELLGAQRGDFSVFQGFQLRRHATITYSATMATDASQADVFNITATNTTAFTISNPTNGVARQRITYYVGNSSGGALGVITWGVLFKYSTWTNPANGTRRYIEFEFDGVYWVETNQSSGDIPV